MNVRFNPGVNRFADPRVGGDSKAKRAAPGPSQPAPSKLNGMFSNFRPENLASKAGAFPKEDIGAAAHFAGARLRSFESDLRQKLGAHASAQMPGTGTARSAESARTPHPGGSFNRFTPLTAWSAPDGRGVHWRTVRDNGGNHLDEFFNPRTGARGHATQWSQPDRSGMRARAVQDLTTGKKWTEHFNPQTKSVSFSFPWSPPDPAGNFSRITINDKGETWQEFKNPKTGSHSCSTPFVLDNGMKRRQVFDCKTNRLWHESVDLRTGAHAAVTDWSSPDRSGARTRMMFDYRTGQSSVQVLRPTAHSGYSGHSRPGTGYAGHTGSTGSTGNTGNTGGASGASGATPKSQEEIKQAEINNALNVLGLDPKDNPTPADIKSAYKKMMLKWHPDKNKTASPAEIQDMSQKINNAKDKLVALGILA